MSQTSISIEQGAPFAGMLADLTDAVIISRVLENDTAVPFGVAVAPGTTADQGADLVDSTSDKVLGIIVHSHAYARDPNGDLDSNGLLKTGAMLNILRRGRMYVICEQDVAFGDRCYIRATSDGGSNTQLGKILGATDDSGKTADARGQVVAMETKTAGNAVLVEVDFTNKA